MKTPAQQRHAAHCRHAKSSEAKRQYWCELSERLTNNLYASNLCKFVAAERAAIARRPTNREAAYGLTLARTTLQAWLREWKTTHTATPHRRSAQDNSGKFTQLQG